jgi:hypothetical protein
VDKDRPRVLNELSDLSSYYSEGRPLDGAERERIAHDVQRVWSRLSYLSQGHTTRAETVKALGEVQATLARLEEALHAPA